MGEVFCAASWSEKKEKQLTEWVSAKPDRYVVWAVKERTAPHPRTYQVDENDLLLRQIALELLYLPFTYEEPSHPILQKLARIQTELHLRSSDFLDQGVKLLANYRDNLQSPFFLSEECYDNFSLYPAVICGAAPSLKEAISSLKQYRDQFLIVGCGAGMQALMAAGVEPHLVVHVDPDPSHRFSKSKIPLFFQLRTDHQVVSKMQGPRFLMAGSGDFPLEKWIEEKVGLSESSDGGWTAATRGAALATALGCKTVFFAGIDFAASSEGLYAKGVAPSQEGPRSDWLFAAAWLNTWVLNHPEQTWAVVSKKNPLMPAIPAADLSSYAGPKGVSSFASEFFSACKSHGGREIWNEIAASFRKCQLLTHQFISHLQTIFPQSPSEDQICLKLLHDLEEQPAVQMVLEPIWDRWEWVIKRQSENHPDALILHRVLLLKSLADQFYV